MANIIPLKDSAGAQFYPQTHEKAVVDSNGVNLQTKLQSITTPTYVTAWDGASTPVVANIPAGVVVTYNGTNYTGTLAASASTDGKIYLVKNGTEYDRYFSTLDLSNNRVWSNLGTTAVTLEVVDDLTTGGSTKALSAEQGKVLNEEIGQLDQGPTIVELSGNPTGSILLSKLKNGGRYQLKFTVSSSATMALTLRSAAGASGPTVQTIASSATYAAGTYVIPFICNVSNATYLRLGDSGVWSKVSGIFLFDSAQANNLETSEKARWIDKTELTSEAVVADHKYVAYSNGVISTSGSSTKVETLTIDPRGYDILSVFVASNSIATTAAIAFYDSETPGENSYLKSASIHNGAETPGKWFSAPVPPSAKVAIISHNYEYNSSPRIFGIKSAIFSDMSADIAALKDKVVPIVLNPIGQQFFHHLHTEEPGSTVIIPSQSLMDVWYAKALGFAFIEVNVHRCADDVLVVKHGGSNGNLGKGLKAVGGADVENVLFSDVTSTWLRENVTYDSTVAKYCTPIPTLDEFCKACKALDMGIVLASYSDAADALTIARKYLADDKIILIGSVSRGDFRGAIYGWWSVSSADDAERLLQRYGLPFILGWSNYSSVNQTVIDAVVKRMHDKGALVATAYIHPTEAIKAFQDGVDILASTYLQTNPSDIGDIKTITHLNDANIVFGEGASYDSGTGAISMADGSSISIPNTGHIDDFVKLSLRIRFDGTLVIRPGGLSASQYVVSHEGDGFLPITFSSAIECKEAALEMVADGAVEIYDWTILLSSVLTP